MLFRRVAGVGCCAKGYSDVSHDDVGDKNDVIAGDKLPFVTTPHLDS